MTVSGSQQVTAFTAKIWHRLWNRSITRQLTGDSVKTVCPWSCDVSSSVAHTCKQSMEHVPVWYCERWVPWHTCTITARNKKIQQRNKENLTQANMMKGKTNWILTAQSKWRRKEREKKEREGERERGGGGREKERERERERESDQRENKQLQDERASSLVFASESSWILASTSAITTAGL